MARHRSSSKKAPEIGLFMECLEEELQPSQVSYWASADKEYNEIQNKLNYYIKQLKAEVVEKGEDCIVLQLNATPPSDTVNSFVPVSTGAVCVRGTKQNVQNSQSYQQVVNSGIITKSTSSPANTFFVMDSGMSFMVGQLPSTDTNSESTSVHSKPVSLGRNKQPVTTAAVATRGKVNSKRQTSILMDSEFSITSSTRKRDKTKNQSLNQEQIPLNLQRFNPDKIYFNDCTLSPCGNYILKVNAKALQPPSKPGESNALGGLNISGKISCGITVLDDVSNHGGRGNADSKEVNFSSVTGKTFPSLVVVARPQLKAKFIPQSKVAQERSALDGRVKGVLMYSPAKFTEWLLQQGLVRSEQTCQNHLHTDLSPVKLKLGMYSDTSKFPYSGGYVWISDCCPSQFVSVFSGSIFEGAPHSPTTLLKLIYHWSCQTNIQNIIQWVKVDNLYVKNFFTLMRAVCTQAVHEKYKKMGGPRKKIEVGVISLGTTSQDGNKRQVKVEVLGVMDYENKLIRLRAIESHSVSLLPSQKGRRSGSFEDERSFKRRFIRILQPLDEWVNKDSTILTDFTVNKAALNSMGFHTVFQVTSDVKYSNQNVMEYLRRIVPRMFQNTLSLLSRQLIQQFLDELVWREVWGPIPSQAFATVIAHMSEQMKLDVNENFLTRLGQVAANPFKKWNYSVWTHAKNCDSKGSHKNHMPKANSMETAFNQGKCTRTRKRGGEQLAGEIALSPVPPLRKNAKISGKEKTKKKEKAGSEELLSDEIIKFIEEGDVLCLENYYYGWLRVEENNNGNSNCGVPVSFSVKCCVCNKRFPENIVLMKHMVLHCQTEPALFTKDVHQCEHCFLGFNTSAALKRHSETVHFLTDEKINLEFLCQICEKKFTGRSELVYHMQRNHVEKELPYECGVCRFRTSVYRLFVRHFVQVHRGEDYVFCPFCLKVVEVSHKSRPITPNVFFYLSHLEKHHRPNLTKDCSHCRLSFIHKGILDQHLESDHGTWKDEPGVECLPELFTGLRMPEPGELIKRDFPLKSLKTSKTNNKNSFSANAFKSLNVDGLDENSTCIECEEFLFNSNHFTGDFKCSKCRYGTCCEKAMLEHSAVFHEAGTQRFTIGRPTVLDSEIFCVCGFSSRSGNKTAKHLAVCGRKTGYASFELALGATQSVSDQDSNQGEGQNVLNFLGLIRKSSDDGSGQDNLAFEKPGNDRSSLGGDLTEFNWTDASNHNQNRLPLVSEETHRKTNTTGFKRKSTIEGETSQKSGWMSDLRPQSTEGERVDSDSVASEAKEHGFHDSIGFLYESVGGTETPAAPQQEKSSLWEREPISAERRVESEKNQGEKLICLQNVSQQGEKN